MSDLRPSLAFEFICTRLETTARMSRIEARGTVRLALREVGKNLAFVTMHDMSVIVTRVLPRMLEKRGIRNPASICEALALALKAVNVTASPTYQDPADVFARLGSDNERRSS